MIQKSNLFKFLLLLFVLSGFGSIPLFADPPGEILNARVLEVDTNDQLVVVGIPNRETEVTRVFMIYVDFNTKFMHAGSLNSVKANDELVIDFFQGDNGKFIARRIDLVRTAKESTRDSNHSIVESQSSKERETAQVSPISDL